MKAVIFDLDGTLQTLEIDFAQLKRSLESYFGSLGVEMVEGPLLEAVDRTTARLARKGLSARKVAAIRDVASGLMDRAEIASYPKVRTIAGVRPMLRRLRKAGYDMAVMSRACRPYVDMSLKRIDAGFDAVFSREDVKRPKPDPEGVLRLLKKFRCEPEDSCVVGDHPFDIMAGKRAGTLAVGVLTGSGSRKRLKEAGADAVLKRADGELAKWLQSAERQCIHMGRALS